MTTGPAQATAPQEERHDVTALYHRMDVGELQSKFGLKVRLVRVERGSATPRGRIPADAAPPSPGRGGAHGRSTEG